MIIPAGPGEDLSRAVHALRGQSLTDWQGVIAGGPCTAETQRLTARDERLVFAMTDEQATWAERVNAGLERASGAYSTVLEPRDYLGPQALEVLVSAAREMGASGAFGGYAFSGPLGVLPVDPLTGSVRHDAPAASAGHPVPGVLTADALAGCKLIPLHAQIVRHELASRVPFEADPDAAGDHRWLLGLAAQGATWAWAGGRVAVTAMDRPAAPVEVARRLSAHARVIDAALDSSGADQASRRAALASHAEAAMLLEAFERLLARQPEAQDRATMLATHTEFGNLFAQWWQRLRFLGRPPRHVLAASVPTSIVGGTGPEWGMPTPAAIASRLVDSAEQGRALVLLGLGRNARHVARVLHARGKRVVGRDDGLDQPPSWAEEDRIPLVLLPREEPWDSAAQYLMTIADDAGYMARVPARMHVLRWSQMPAALRKEWTSETLPRLLRGELLRGHADAPQTTRAPAEALKREGHVAASAAGDRP